MSGDIRPLNFCAPEIEAPGKDGTGGIRDSLAGRKRVRKPDRPRIAQECAFLQRNASASRLFSTQAHPIPRRSGTCAFTAFITPATFLTYHVTQRRGIARRARHHRRRRSAWARIVAAIRTRRRRRALRTGRVPMSWMRIAVTRIPIARISPRMAVGWIAISGHHIHATTTIGVISLHQPTIRRPVDRIAVAVVTMHPHTATVIAIPIRRAMGIPPHASTDITTTANTRTYTAAGIRRGTARHQQHTAQHQHRRDDSLELHGEPPLKRVHNRRNPLNHDLIQRNSRHQLMNDSSPSPWILCG